MAEALRKILGRRVPYYYLTGGCISTNVEYTRTFVKSLGRHARRTNTEDVISLFANVTYVIGHRNNNAKLRLLSSYIVRVRICIFCPSSCKYIPFVK